MPFLSHLLYKLNTVIISPCSKSAFDVAIHFWRRRNTIRIRLHISIFCFFVRTYVILFKQVFCWAYYRIVFNSLMVLKPSHNETCILHILFSFQHHFVVHLTLTHHTFVAYMLYPIHHIHLTRRYLVPHKHFGFVLVYRFTRE